MPPAAPPDPFENRLAQHWPVTQWADVGLLVAVSGGADSLALLHALARQAQASHVAARIEVAHFHHGWRGDSADEDARQVAQVSARLGLPHHEGRGQARSVSEEEARRQRYGFLEDVACRRGLRYLATAHHRDDQVETVLLRVLRGTGIRGLAGIPPFRAVNEALTIARPLLWARGQELRAYLERLGESYREDPSNESLAYTRNRVRHQLLPQLREEFNPQVDDALYRLSALAADAHDELDQLIAAHRRQLDCQVSPTSISLNRNGLRQLSNYLITELMVSLWREAGWPLQGMGQEQWRRLQEVHQTRQTIHLPGNVRVACQGDQLLLHRDAADEPREREVG